MANNKTNILPHLLMAGACTIWGLMAPLGKHAMTNGIDGFAMVFLRVAGAALCFWITSLCLRLQQSRRHNATTRQQRQIVIGKTNLREIGLFAIAAVFGITCNQCCFTIGLSLTSPVHASILTTTLPIFALLIGALFLGRRITWRKGAGVLIGLMGAIILVLSNSNLHQLTENNNPWGDLLVIGAQCSFALYLNFFQQLLQRHSVITIQKWMMTFATIYVLPIAWPHLVAIHWATLMPRVWAEAAFVVLCGTYIAYIMMTKAQKHLQPTVVAMYNYVQPLVACIVSVMMGVGHFGLAQMAAVVLVFSGVWLVTQARHASTGINQ